MKLSESTVKKSENLHFMRFVASIMVIFTHSYGLSGYKYPVDFIDRYTNGIITIGDICVFLFFLCSGYLISKSVMRADKFIPYIKARLKRLLPPLAFVVVCAVLVGAVFTSLSVGEYFSSAQTYKYLLNAVLVPIHSLPGVFENNAYGTTVNGSLWTLPVEFVCYIVCFVFYKCKLLQKKRFWYTAPLALGLFIISGFLPTRLKNAVMPCLFFYIGMLYYVYREHIELKLNLVPIALLLLAASFLAPVLIKTAMIIFWPYILFTLWFAAPQISSYLGKTGDISYGIYLWGFFVQQTLTLLWGGRMPQMLNFLLAAAISVVLGIITFYLTEKPLIKKH